MNVRLTEQRIGVVGHNGSGKSTFARLLNGLIVPSQGSVRVDGFDTVKQASEVRKKVGFLFTSPDAQIIMPTVAEDVAFSLRRSKLSKKERSRRVAEVLTKFGLDQHADHPAHLLSGGQKQLLALAAVLVTEPQLIVMDEPTTLLDIRNAAMIKRVIAKLPQRVVLITHHLDQLENFDRVLVFDGGRLVADGVPAVALERYRELMEAQLAADEEAELSGEGSDVSGEGSDVSGERSDVSGERSDVSGERSDA